MRNVVALSRRHEKHVDGAIFIVAGGCKGKEDEPRMCSISSLKRCQDVGISSNLNRHFLTGYAHNDTSQWSQVLEMLCRFTVFIMRGFL